MGISDIRQRVGMRCPNLGWGSVTCGWGLTNMSRCGGRGSWGHWVGERAHLQDCLPEVQTSHTWCQRGLPGTSRVHQAVAMTQGSRFWGFSNAGHTYMVQGQCI